MNTSASEIPSARFSIGVLEDKRGRLLLARRSPLARLGPAQWGFPAGHIEAGESARQCMLRELNEEIGPDHELEQLAYIGPFRDTLFGGKFEINLYHYRWLHGSVVLNDEHTEFAWVSQGDFLTYDVMLGIELDIVLLKIWPREMFDPKRLSP